MTTLKYDIDFHHMIAVGRTGTGKSLFVKNYLNMVHRQKYPVIVISFNPTLESGYTIHDEYSNIISAHTEENNSPWKVYNSVMEIRKLYPKETAIIVVWDEAHEAFPQSAGLNDPLLQLFTRGRHENIKNIAITQRPSLISKTALTQCDRAAIFRVTGVDSDALVKHFDFKELEFSYRLEEGHFFYIKNNKLYRGVLHKPSIYDIFET